MAGTARLHDNGDGTWELTIITQAKKTRTVKGKKVVTYEPNERKYKVADVRPDPAVASPAFSLETDDKEPSVYHVGANEWGVFCDCPDHHYRRQNDRTPCKHCKAMQAVGLLPQAPTTDYVPSNDPLPE
jgi:hypothetical protein